MPLSFTGFADFIGPKGKGATGDFYHRAEILIHPKLLVDVGDLLGYAPNKIQAGVGYEYCITSSAACHSMSPERSKTPSSSKSATISKDAGG